MFYKIFCSDGFYFELSVSKTRCFKGLLRKKPVRRERCSDGKRGRNINFRLSYNGCLREVLRWRVSLRAAQNFFKCRMQLRFGRRIIFRGNQRDHNLRVLICVLRRRIRIRIAERHRLNQGRRTVCRADLTGGRIAFVIRAINSGRDKE